MSSSNFRGSCGIEEFSLAIDGLEKPPIGGSFPGNQIHSTVKKVFQGVQQAEIGICLLAGGKRGELDEKIEIAGFGLELAGGGRAEKFQPADMKRSAKAFQLGPVLFD
jgi:hypothetical protein